MANYRQRIKVQMAPKAPKVEVPLLQKPKNDAYAPVKNYIKKALSMYRRAADKFEPLSDEEELCINEINKYIYDLEILDKGSDEEREEVLHKYG